MQSEFARDLKDQDQPVYEAANERPGKPIKMRLQPAIFRLPKGHTSGQYRSWRDVHWTLDLDSVEETFAFREALRAFFRALNREGLAAVTARLQQSSGKADAA
jgi:hypothetical protein